jgi:hypothetical protein
MPAVVSHANRAMFMRAPAQSQRARIGPDIRRDANVRRRCGFERRTYRFEQPLQVLRVLRPGTGGYCKAAQTELC